jgi:hypothetical protein
MGQGYTRKDLIFPPDSVEATQPHYGKKQRLTHKHLKGGLIGFFSPH